MQENITENVGTIVSENKRNCFDEHIYTELKAFICGDSSLPDKKNILSGLPSFWDVVEKVNSFVLHQDLRLRVISDTLGKLLSELDGGSEKPAFLVSYLCSEVVRNAVLCKFNHVLGCECVDLQDLSYRIGDNVAEANKTFLSIRICDPSVWYGVFLRSMLNEMIAIKSHLGILVDKEGNPLFQYKFVVGEAGLTVLDKKEFRTIVLDGNTTESRYLQESLYYEKVALLHNCLFGADVDSFSVLICKLRLWHDIIGCLIGGKDTDFPYIESNIICGDALVSRFTLKDDLLVALKSINQTVADYKRLADSIKTVEESSDRK